jgi:hypothetical protein
LIAVILIVYGFNTGINSINYWNNETKRNMSPDEIERKNRIFNRNKVESIENDYS